MHHKQIFRSQLFSVFNEVAGVVLLTGYSVIDIIFCHSIISATGWYWGLTLISIFQIKYVRVCVENIRMAWHMPWAPLWRGAQKLLGKIKIFI